MAKRKLKIGASLREAYAEAKRKMYALRGNPQFKKELLEAVKEFRDVVKMIKEA